MQKCSSPGEMQTREVTNIPKDWEVVPLSNVIYQQFRPEEIQTNEDYRILGVRWYAAGPFEKAKKKGSAIKAKKLYLARENDFIYNRLFAWKGSFGVIPKSLDSTYVSNEFPLFKVNEKKLDPHFLWRYFSQPNVWSFIENQSSGTAKVSRLRYKERQLTDMRIPLPPLHEQHCIAAILSSVQEARKKTAVVIGAAQGMKKSLMKHIFTYGPVPLAEACKVLLKETEIGMVREHWEVMKLGNVASNIRSGSTPRGGSTTYLDKGIPLIRSQNVLMNNLVLDDVAYVSKETHEIMLRSQIQPGDVLLNITGASIGRVAVAPSTLNEANVNQHVCRIRPKEVLISEFLSYYLASEIGQWQIMSTQIGATRQGLNYQHVRNFLIPMPSIEEQIKIADILDAIDHKIRAEDMHMVALDNLFKTLLYNLMTGKIRVNHLEMGK